MFFPKAASAFLTASVLLFGSPAWTDEYQTYGDYIINYTSSYCQNEYDNPTDTYDDIQKCIIAAGALLTGMLIENCRITGKSALFGVDSATVSYHQCFTYVGEVVDNHSFYLDDFTNAHTHFEKIDFIADVVRNNKLLLHQRLFPDGP